MSDSVFNRLRLRRATIAILCLCAVIHAALGAPPKALYSLDFEKAQDGPPPANLLVLTGTFAVKSVDGNKVLELPGDPLDGFGFLFGPDGNSTLAAGARIFATASGKLQPEFGIGVAGASGYKLWLMPAVGELQMVKGEDVIAKVPYAWKSGTWTVLRLQLRKAADGKHVVEAKAWKQGSAEPKGWLLTAPAEPAPAAGRASAWGTPFSATPILFDDLLVAEPGE